MSKLPTLRIVVMYNNLPIFTFERAITSEQPSGNFATGMVSVKGKRYRISLDKDKQIYEGHPVEGIHDACMSLAYKSYYDNCMKEQLSAFTYQAWLTHGCPLDGIGSKLGWDYEPHAPAVAG